MKIRIYLVLSLQFCLINGIASTGEKLQLNLVTDRSLYISGESILLKAFINGDKLHNLGEKTLYVELISSDGLAIRQNKYLIEKSVAVGELSIPHNISSGNYYLKAYTRYLRNYGPEKYTYLQLKVVNPYQDYIEVQDPQVMNRFEKLSGMEINMVLDSDSKIRKGNKMTISFSILENLSSSIIDACITIVPKGAQSCSLTTGHMLELQVPDQDAKMKYHPETRNNTLTGQVVFSEDNVPVIGALIAVQPKEIGSEPYFVKSDSFGQFSVSMPIIHESDEVLLSLIKMQDLSRQVNYKIDREFCQLPLKLKKEPFFLNENETIALNDFIIRKEVWEQYYDKTEIPKRPSINPFYSQPTRSILMEDYIDLINLEEFFHELVPELRVVRKKSGIHIESKNINNGMKFLGPGFFIDYIYIDDVESILAIPTKHIEKVDLFTHPYYKGEARFTGIVSIITKKGTQVNIGKPMNSILVGYSKEHEDFLCLPDNFNKREMPDVRNTLFWSNDIQIVPGQVYKLSFQASEFPGEYTCVLRGFDDKGNSYNAELEFTIE